MGTVATAMQVFSPAIGAPTEAYWGQNVAEHVVQRFTSAGQRDSNWSAPPHGSVCVITSSPPTMWQRVGSGWVQIGPAILASPFGAAQSVGGDLSVNGHVILPDPPGGNPTDSNHATRKGYVDTQDNLRVKVAGDTMTGPLILEDGPTLDHHATRKQYVDGMVSLRVDKEGDVMSGDLTVGGNPDGAVGTKIYNEGLVSMTCNDTFVSLRIRKTGTGDAVGQQYLRFEKGTGTPIGSIAIDDGAASVVYNKTSDHRLKVMNGPIEDAAERVARLAHATYRGSWRRGGRESDMLNAHDVAEVAPYAVTGDKDAVTEDGEIDPQQVDYSALVPVLVAALGDALDRIADLEARAA